MISQKFTQPFSKSVDYFWKQMSSKVLEAKYAVRGKVPTKALEIGKQLKAGSHQYPFTQITSCNIGNPQQFGQRPISYHRQVLSVLVNPQLANTNYVTEDIKRRAKLYLDQITSIGAYTQSIGIPIVRKGVASYLQRVQNLQQRPNQQDIFLTSGASQGVHIVLSTLITKKTDAVMIPIPQYPLYSACLTLFNGSQCPYHLDEQNGWKISISQIQSAYKKSKQEGNQPKVIVIINPGNPTGAILDKNCLLSIIQFAVKNKLLIIADQVYRNNVYKPGLQFLSVRAILQNSQYKYQAELISLNSTSKGLLGQCGMRAGYMYLYNINPKVISQLIKLKSINLCSNALGQCLVDLMVNPPNQKMDLKQTVDLYKQQTKNIFDSLKNRASIVQKYLRQMKNITTQQINGAMYAFPQIKFSQKRLQQAKDQGAIPDLLYCLQCLQKTGIALVPGSGFLQKEQSYHFRITTLILPDSKLKQKMQVLKEFNDRYHQQ